MSLKLGMRWKLLIAFAGAFTIVFVIIAVWVMTITTGNAYERLRTQLGGITVGGANTIDPSTLERLIRTVPAVPDPDNPMGLGYPDSPLYREVALDLFTINTIDGQAQPYTYFRDPKDGELYYGASAGYYYEPQFGVPWRLPARDIVSDETYALMERGLEEFTEVEANTDDYGTWISAFAPITQSNGRVVGAIGIDYPYNYVTDISNQVRRRLIMILSVTYSILLLLVLYVSAALVRPLRRLTSATKRITEGEYDLDLQPIVETRFPDEMAELAHSFAIMAEQVAAREQSLTREVTRLRVEIDHAKREAAVKEITESDFFSDLTSKAADMRRRMRDGEEGTQ
jgi:HAMP domain-containing protein